MIGPGVVPQGFVPVAQSNPGNADPKGAVHPLAGGQPFAVDSHNMGGPHTHTQYPYVTGTSVLAIKYKDGILMACDTLGSYGSTKRYKSVERMSVVGNNTVLGASGEYSDFK